MTSCIVLLLIFRETPGGVIKCPRPWCGAEFKLEKCFRDKAAELELASSVLGCSNTGCPWTGDSQHYNVSYLLCGIVRCTVREGIFIRVMQIYLAGAWHTCM